MTDQSNAERIKRLTDALIFNGLPTAEEVREAMDLAYRAGKIDGAIECTDRMLNAVPHKDLP